MELDKSSITGLVDRAERRGLVLRVPSVTDRRSVLVRLTAGGREMVTQAARLFDADVAGLCSACCLLAIVAPSPGS
jgi:MarR family transcriptional regulator, lower aerobic nicotinate degradation pathway regulator